ncbi:MAG: lytic transglycosylase domain-containing protein [Rhodocyclales bacterium]|nr:lytic transglycosylase domain-containing protein [Rhodocyclales bacterium]
MSPPSLPAFLRRCFVLPALLLGLAAPVLAEDQEIEAPRVASVLEQGLAAELGSGLGRNPELAIALYCHAGTLGSAEGYFRVGRVLALGPDYIRNAALANAYFALAARLGHRAAEDAFDQTVEAAALEDDCGKFVAGLERQRFDLDGYLAGLTPVKRGIADLIRRLAPRHQVDARLAIAVALVESNLNPGARSPKNAEGVMQLIPGTQQRFGVLDPWDVEANVKGGLAYLKWLGVRFGGDWELVAAAYNAGEGAVERHRGIPPYRETRDYVRRVLFFAGRHAVRSGQG